MDNIIHPFQIPIYQSFIEEGSFTQIKKDILSYIDANYDKFYTPWLCDTKASFELRFEDRFKSINFNNEIKKATENYLKYWNIIPASITIKNSWINISEPGNFQEIHDHIQYGEEHLFSGTLYIDVNKDSGNLFLENPNPLLSNLLPANNIFPQTKTITPKTGLLVSFPSWMRHRVGKNNSNQNRISISWNITLK